MSKKLKKKALFNRSIDQSKVVGFRISGQMYRIIEDDYYNKRRRSFSEAVRLFLERALSSLATIEPLVAEKEQMRMISDSSEHDYSLQLPPDLFNRLENFRYDKRIPSRATAVRILLKHGIGLTSQG